jgi:hypothetical protein
MTRQSVAVHALNLFDPSLAVKYWYDACSGDPAELWDQIPPAARAANRSSFQVYIRGLRAEVREALSRGAACGCPKTAATCRELTANEPVGVRRA